MSKNIAIYTAVFSEDKNKPFDNLKDFDNSLLNDADFYCFTNLNFESDRWKIINVDIDESSGRKMARKYKILPHLSMSNYEYHFWMDTSFLILESPKKIVREYLKDHNICAFKHPDRIDVYHEGQMCKVWKLDDSELIDKQLDYIESDGYPKNNGLCETGVVLRRNNEKIKKFNELWWTMISNFSLRDQLSFNYCLWKLGINYNVFDGLTNIQQGSPFGSKQTKLFKLYPHKNG